MKAVFSVRGDGLDMSTPSYNIGIGFNGVPNTVILEIDRVQFEGYSGSGDDPVTQHRQDTVNVCRAVLAGSHARAIASALLSAATEVRSL